MDNILPTIELLLIACSPLIPAMLIRPKMDRRYLTISDSTFPRAMEDYNRFADFLDEWRARRAGKGAVKRGQAHSTAGSNARLVCDHSRYDDITLKPTKFDIDSYDPEAVKKRIMEMRDFERDTNVYVRGETYDEWFTIKAIDKNRTVLESLISGKTYILPYNKPVEVDGCKMELELMRMEHGTPGVCIHHEIWEGWRKVDMTGGEKERLVEGRERE